jgi:diacylglycerol kinase family enzyme
MLAGPRRPPASGHIVSVHDQASFSLRARRPIAVQVDGEYVGERECVAFSAIPHALRVIA